MTFAEHGIHGAVAHALIGSACGMSGGVHTGFVVLGALAGMAPDLVDWVANQVFKSERWTIYGEMHHGKLGLAFAIIPGYWLHCVIDYPFHTRPGENWWPRLWWLMISIDLVFVAGALLYLF